MNKTKYLIRQYGDGLFESKEIDLASLGIEGDFSLLKIELKDDGSISAKIATTKDIFKSEVVDDNSNETLIKEKQL